MSMPNTPPRDPEPTPAPTPDRDPTTGTPGTATRGGPRRKLRLPNDFFFWFPFVVAACYIAYTVLSDPRL